MLHIYVTLELLSGFPLSFHCWRSLIDRLSLSLSRENREIGRKPGWKTLQLGGHCEEHWWRWAEWRSRHMKPARVGSTPSVCYKTSKSLKVNRKECFLLGKLRDQVFWGNHGEFHMDKTIGQSFIFKSVVLHILMWLQGDIFIYVYIIERFHQAN